LLGFPLLFVVLSMGSVSGIGISWKPGNAPSAGRNCVKMVKDNGFRRLSFLRGVAPIDVTLILGS
jgi:hypothetical protein